jgi:hypothetical protein
MFHRRAFLRSAFRWMAAAPSMALAPPLAATVSTGVRSEPAGNRKRIAFLGTAVYQHSHAQHFLDRLTAGYAWRGTWQPPRVDVAAVYIDQFPENDLGRARIAKHGLRQAGSVKEALTLGTDRLAVDGVVIIAEHGEYNRTELGQVRYPRYEWFKEVVRVFEASGRSVPVFNDKHLSTNWPECVAMVDDSRRLGFPFLAGSSLPVTWRHPAVEMPVDADLQESVCVAYGGIDSYDFHAFETAQCMSERRRGGEVGIRAVRTVQGDDLWALLGSDDRRVTRELFVAGLTRSHNLPVEGGYPTAPVTLDWARATLPATTGLFVEHLDGFRTTAFLTGIRDFNYAGRLRSGETITCQMYLPMPGHGSTTADFFNPLTWHIENLMLEGRTPYPVERTLLTSGMVIAGVQSKARGGVVVETPDMAIAYQPTPESAFWSD